MKQKFKAGDWVEVLSREEILKTLDRKGQLEAMPFMPEMFAYCGKRFRVYKRAHKTCDTVNDYMGRRMKDAVHLEETRCDGLSHGGCEASCLLFWKTSWLRPVDGPHADGGGGHHSLSVTAIIDSARACRRSFRRRSDRSSPSAIGRRARGRSCVDG